jgi:hypothetical protein
VHEMKGFLPEQSDRRRWRLLPQLSPVKDFVTLLDA